MVFGDIGVAGFHEAVDQRDHLGDMFGRARLDARRQAAQRRNIFLEIIVGRLGQFADRDAALGGARVDLVVDVGDVAHIGDVALRIEMPQQAEQHVEHDDRPRVADMREVVDRRPAHIHAHARRIDRDEVPLGARQCIVQLQ